jgi:hypothetical protein
MGASASVSVSVSSRRLCCLSRRVAGGDAREITHARRLR